MLGERLSHARRLRGQKLAAGAVLLVALRAAAVHGRGVRRDRAVSRTSSTTATRRWSRPCARAGARSSPAFAWQGEPPDPQAEATFAALAARSRPARPRAGHRALFEFYRELLRLRRDGPALSAPLEARTSRGRAFEARACPRGRPAARPTRGRSCASCSTLRRPSTSPRCPSRPAAGDGRSTRRDRRWDGPGVARAVLRYAVERGEAAVTLSAARAAVVLSAAGRAGDCMERYVCIHGHFYQPPRENPWLEAIELQDSAYPYHDWNERITAECYAPNAASRILDDRGRIIEHRQQLRPHQLQLRPDAAGLAARTRRPTSTRRSSTPTARAASASPATARPSPRPTTT